MNGKLIAKILDHLEFSEVIRIAKTIKNYQTTIMPYISSIYVVDKFPMLKYIQLCCRTKKLTLLNSRFLDTKTLFMLPLLESLTICVGSLIDNAVFKYLPNLKVLQILALNKCELDSIINKKCIVYLKNVQYLHISSNNLKDYHFKYLTNLKVLILENSIVTPHIMNDLNRLEICIINKCLYKYVHSLKNIAIIKKIGYLNNINICNIN